MTPWRRATQVVGAGIVALAVWLTFAANVDTDAEHGPTNCGRNAIVVLRDGPSVNRDVLSVHDCRVGAVGNLAICAALAVIGLTVLVVASGRVGHRPGRRWFTSIPLLVANSVAAALVPAALAAVLGRVHVALVPVGIALGAYPTVRCLRLGVTVDSDHVVVRNILRSHRWSVQDVEAFVIVPSAWWTKVDEWVAVRPTRGPDVGVSVLALPVFRFLQGPARGRLVRMNAALAEAQHAAGRPHRTLG